jgi:mRNA interferase MazF
MEPLRGEVWWGETLVHASALCRADRGEAIHRLSEVIVVPLTTTVRRLPTEDELDESDGMPRSCVTSLDNLSTIAKGQLVDKITALSPEKMDDICRALNLTVAC